jgi:hypothetical protein
MRLSRTQIAALFAAVSILAATTSRAEIVFCNQFGHQVNVAIAYPQTDGSFISRGWLSLSPGYCAPFDTALHVGTFFFRAETERYREGGRYMRYFWGKGRLFAMWENDNYQYYDAEHRVLKSTLTEFTPGPVAENGDVSATVTFKEGGSTVTIHSQASDTPPPQAGGGDKKGSDTDKKASDTDKRGSDTDK